MNLTYFLLERVHFVRGYYEKASSVFEQEVRAIDQEMAPYDHPPYDESDEPPYLHEWLQAREALEFLGLTCVSALAASLKAYLLECEERCKIQLSKNDRKKLFRDGLANGYLEMFEAQIGLPKAECPADLDLLEQVVLARNTAEHPDDFRRLIPRHRKESIKKHPRPFFLDDFEGVFLEGELADVSFLVPRVSVSRETLFQAMDEIEKLAKWLDESLPAR